MLQRIYTLTDNTLIISTSKKLYYYLEKHQAYCNEWQVRGESRSTSSFISTRSNRQISSRGIEGNVDKAESKSEAEQWVRATNRQQGSKRSGEEVNSPGSTRKDKLGKPLGNVSQGKTRLRSECMCVSEWGAGEVRQSRLMSEWWQLCDWCNGGRECVCAVHDGRCSPWVMCSCSEWQPDSWQI